VHVAFATDGRRVAQLARDLFNGGAQIALCLSRAVEAFELIQRHRREDRARPGSEVLRCNVFSGDFLRSPAPGPVHPGKTYIRSLTQARPRLLSIRRGCASAI
jgi:hypothetical protein